MLCQAIFILVTDLALSKIERWLADKKTQICYYEIKFKKYSKIIEFMLNIRNFLCYSNIVMDL